MDFFQALDAFFEFAIIYLQMASALHRPKGGGKNLWKKIYSSFYYLLKIIRIYISNLIIQPF